MIDDLSCWRKGKEGLAAPIRGEALNNKIPVIGVAKSYFKGCQKYALVYRSKSKKPLYISSIGIDLNFSAELIKNWGGESRIPGILMRVDYLTMKIWKIRA